MKRWGDSPRRSRASFMYEARQIAGRLVGRRVAGNLTPGPQPAVLNLLIPFQIFSRPRRERTILMRFHDRTTGRVITAAAAASRGPLLRATAKIKSQG